MSRPSSLLALILLFPLAGCAPSLNRAAAQGRTDIVAQWLDKGADVNSRSPSYFRADPRLNPPLIRAVQGGHLETVNLLLKRGADPNRKNFRGQTALMVATHHGWPKVTKTLLAQGADIEARDREGRTPLMLATSNGAIEAMRILSTHGADANVRDGKGETPLMLTASNDAIEAMRVLLTHGADANVRDGEGKTPLMLTASNGNIAGMRILLDHGAAIEAGDKEGKTPLMLAASNGLVAGVQFLMTRGADIRKKDKTGRTAEVLAEDRGHIRTVIALQQRQASQPKSGAMAGVHSDVDRPSYRNKENRDDYALVVGIDDYSNLPQAVFAERDAQAVRNHLVAMGYPNRNVVLLTGDQATRTGLNKYLKEWLPRNVKSRSSVFFYFAGHGAPHPTTGNAFLVPWDGDPKFLKTPAYSLEQLYASLKGLRAQRVIVALDACFSGIGGRSVLPEGVRPLVAKVSVPSVPDETFTVLTAASNNEITSTLKDEGHGIFTYFFLKGLNGAAKKPPGQVTVQSLYEYLKPRVQEEARRQNRDQTPTLRTTKDVVLRIR